MSRQIEIRYIVIKGSGHVLTETFPLGDIENGRVITWLKANNASDDNCEIHVSEFTGLHDKNGVGLYENDIISFPCGTIGFMSWSEQKAGWCICEFEGDDPNDEFTGRIYATESVLVGNIHENPELLSP